MSDLVGIPEDQFPCVVAHLIRTVDLRDCILIILEKGFGNFICLLYIIKCLTYENLNLESISGKKSVVLGRPHFLGLINIPEDQWSCKRSPDILA